MDELLLSLSLSLSLLSLSLSLSLLSLSLESFWTVAFVAVNAPGFFTTGAGCDLLLGITGLGCTGIPLFAETGVDPLLFDTGVDWADDVPLFGVDWIGAGALFGVDWAGALLADCGFLLAGIDSEMYLLNSSSFSFFCFMLSALIALVEASVAMGTLLTAVAVGILASGFTPEKGFPNSSPEVDEVTPPPPAVAPALRCCCCCCCLCLSCCACCASNSSRSLRSLSRRGIATKYMYNVKTQEKRKIKPATPKIMPAVVVFVKSTSAALPTGADVKVGVDVTGFEDGRNDGVCVGASWAVGDAVGRIVGVAVGGAVGSTEGLLVDGSAVGENDGLTVVGDAVGVHVGE